MKSVRREIKISKKDVQGTFSITHTQLQWMNLFAGIGSPPSDALSTLALDQAVASGQLFDFNQETGKFVPSDLLLALYELRKELALFFRRRRMFNEMIRDVWARAWAEHSNDNRPVEIPTFAVLDLIAMYDTQQNLKAMLITMIEFLRGLRSSPMPRRLQTQTPVEEFQRELENERVAPAQLIKAIDGQEPWIVSAAANASPEEERAMWLEIDKIRDAIGDDLLTKLLSGQATAGDLDDETKARLERALSDPGPQTAEPDTSS